MLPRLIAFCLSRRPLVLISFAAFLALGYAAFTALNIEAYPDPAPPIIEIIAQYPGQSPEEMERYVTIPIEIAIASTPGLKYLRSNTVYALSFIRLQFEYGRDYYFVRQQTLNRLKDAVLPPGVQPVISPAGGISEIFRYQLKGPPDMDVMQLKTLQDWVVERRLRIVPGVADVLVLGGKTKEFQVEIDLNRMIAHGLTLPQIISAISAGNSNVGGRTIAVGEQSVTVRGIGVVGTLQDIGNIVLTQQGGVPVLLSDVANVQIGFTPRLGIAGRDEVTDIVTGIVLMQKFERTSEMVARVRAAIDRINTDGTLPPGVKVEPFYDRGDLVAVTIKTVLHNMFFGIALIFLIQWVFLGNLRCALIVSATIPVALFLAVIITVLRGESANLLSVGAIDLGIIVDATVIMVENIFRHLAHDEPAETANPDEKRTDKLRRILNAAVEVDKPIFFSVIITIAAFLPLFTMQGVEGQIFGPMSRTYAYALIGAVIATFTVTPVLASILLPARVEEVETILVRYIRKVYEFVLPRAVRRYRIAATIAVAFLAVCGVLGLRLGTEFLPKLEEGNLWIRALLPPTITLDAGMDAVARMRNVIKSYPPVRTVVSEQGRGEDGTDPDGSFVAEFFVPLKPLEEWPQGLTKEEHGQADEPAAPARVRRRRLQFLAIHPGQYRGGGLRREGREFGQDFRPRSRRTGALVQVAEDGDRDRAGRDQSGRVQPAGSAQSHHQDQSREGGPLRLLGRRHQLGRAGGDRRPGGHPGLRGRDEFRPYRALRAGIPPQHRRHPRHSRRAAEQRFQRRRPPISRSASSAR